MSDTISLEKLDQRAYRYSIQDGLSEMLMAVLFFCGAAAVAHPSRTWMVGLGVVMAFPAYRKLHQRFCVPRIGYVEPKTEAPGRLLRGMMTFALIVLAATALGLIIFSDVSDPEVWKGWSPALVAVLCCGGLNYAASRSGLRRYYLLMVIFVTAGFGFSFVEFAAPMVRLEGFILTIAGLLFLWGLALFVVFLRTYPVVAPEEPEETSDGQH